MRIKDKEMDTLRGLNEALISLVNLYGGADGSSHRFIFSDGFDLYAFNWFWGGDNMLIYHDASKNLAMVATQNSLHHLAYESLREVFDPFQPIPLNPGSLIYIPYHGFPVWFDFIITTNEIRMHRRVEHTTYKWLSLPALPENPTSIFNIISPGWSNPTEILTQNGFAYSIVPTPPNQPIPQWVYSQNFPVIADHNIGMKIYFGDTIFGDNIGEMSVYQAELKDVSQYDLEAYQSTWITYNLANSQSLEDALGDNFSFVLRVEGEGWVYDPINPVNRFRPMEFGKMYIILTNRDITGFEWKDSRKLRGGEIFRNEPAIGKLNRKTEYFTFKSRDSYEVIDIINLSESEINCVEIGVFAGEICVGASKIDEFPVQVLAYTKEFEGSQLVFRALYQNGRVTQFSPIVSSYNRELDNYEDGILVAGDIDYAIVKLNNGIDSSNEKIPSIIVNHGVYPNPFNPSTTITFSISKVSTVSVEIFNIKGQRVKSLIKDSLPVGKHFVQWNGTDENNRTISSGIYFYRVSTDNHQITGKMMLMK